MYRLLLVDDHPYQVETIAQTIEESELAFQCIYKAYSGMEALETMKQVPVDIVITDIRMPEMSGIELIENIRQMSGRVKCVLLSGYADFEYAQQALALQTSNYLMKPVENNELVRTLQQLLDQLTQEREAEEAYRQTVSTLYENLPRLRSVLLQDLIQGKPIPRSELTHKLQAYGIPFACDDPFSLLVFQLEDELSGYNEYDVSLILYAVSNMAEELFVDQYELWHARTSQRRIAMMIRSKQPGAAMRQDELEKQAKELRRLVYRFLHHIVSIGVVPEGGRFPEQLRHAYKLGTAVFNSPESKAAGLFAAVSELPGSALRGTIESLYRQPSLMALLETGQWQEARTRLDEVFAELEEKSKSTHEYRVEAFHVIAGTYQFAAHRYGKRLGEIIGSGHLDLLQEHAHWDVQMLKSWALRTFDRLQETIHAAEDGDHPTLVNRIRQYIISHLDQELSLQSISDKVGFHPAYLSKVYKQETGVTLSDYLMQVRMEHSAELLKNTDIKIYEVSSRVGYQTTHYFIKVFKKAFGMTPREYRNRLKWEE
ncbi:response regulator [Paenibacillus daejeonensis]|uniref:response regulator n=1 Tax=Paenibacillus daejeonensis TaxID=135193 RepID=UPI000369DFAF|nr:response regulator [Paenibacillus daejeonensis]